MEVTRRVRVDFVQYRGDAVLINVVPELVDEQGAVVGSLPTENVHSTQTDLTALAVENGAKVWGDVEVEQVIATAAHPAVEKEEPQLRFAGQPITW